MTVLSDRDIKEYLKQKRIVITPEPNDEQIQPAWVDLTLGDEFHGFKQDQISLIDPKEDMTYTEPIHTNSQKKLIVHPKEFLLGRTEEHIKLPADLAAYVDGRSSLGRLGIIVHVTAGWIDPGFSGNLVLEITNLGKVPVALYPGMRICKLVFMKLSSESERPYYARRDAKYKDQQGVTGSKVFKEFQG